MKYIFSQETVTNILKDDQNIKDQSIEISKAISNRENEITDLVEALEFALTSPDVELRAKSTKLLSETLSAMPLECLNAKQIEFIGSFYSDRLKDQHSVLPSVFTGILSVAKMTNLPDGVASQILHSIFKNVACQSQVREDREKLLQIIATFSKRKVQELLLMSSDFVYGVINAIDGERDPRILLYIFDYLTSFFKTYPLLHLAEEMFEVCACYFPVDFHPAPNDSKAITREMLAESLANCLCGSIEFAENCITLLLEKMDSQLNVAKLDSLHLLSKCAASFRVQDIESQFEAIWAALRIELCPGTNKETTLAALASLENLIKYASVEPLLCDNMLVLVFDTIEVHLADVNTRLFVPCTAIALAVSRASKYSAQSVTSKLLQPILEQIAWNDKIENIIQRCTLLDLLMQFLKIAQNLHPDLEFIAAPQMENIENVFISCLDANNNDGLLKIGMQSLIIIVRQLSQKKRLQLYKCILEKFSKNRSSDLNLISNDILCAYAQQYPDEVMNEIVQKLLINENTTDTIAQSNQKIQLLCSLIVIAPFTQTVYTHLTHLIFAKSSSMEFRLIGLKNVRRILEENPQNSELVKLFNTADTTDQYVQLRHLSGNEPFLNELAAVLGLVVKSLAIPEQSNIISKYLPEMDLQKVDDIFITYGLLSYLNESVTFAAEHFANIITELVKVSLCVVDETLRSLSNQLIGSLFNKMPKIDEFNIILREMIDKLQKEIELKESARAVEVLAWITKGLLIGGHPEVNLLVEYLIGILNHTTLAATAPNAFNIISMEVKTLHLPIVKHLYKQKLFQLCLNRLWNQKNSYSLHDLTAITYVLKQTPAAMLKINLEKVGPILFKCLELNQSIPIHISLDIIHKFLQEKNDYFKAHLNHLISSCLTLSKFKESLKIRIAAIECLTTIAEYPTIDLLPHKQQIIYGLVPQLDDSKRLVRTAAVKCRNIWFLIGNS